MKAPIVCRSLICALFLAPFALADTEFEPGAILYKRTDGLNVAGDDFTGDLPDNNDVESPFGELDDPGSSIITQINVDTEAIAPTHGIDLSGDNFDLAFVFYFYDDDGQFSFTENFDDRVQVTVTPIAGPTDTTPTGAAATHSDVSWNTRTYADFDFGAAGWNCAEVLMSEDGGGAQSADGIGFGYFNEAASFVETDYGLVGGGATFDADGNGDSMGAIICSFDPSVDTDGDNIPDGYEELFFPGDLSQLGAGDFDNDGVSDVDEFTDQTDPTEADEDMDGLNDGEEKAAGTDPKDPDSDNDGLLDGVETNTGTFASESDTGTDPLNPDTDADGAPDGAEVAAGTDPNDAGSLPALWTVRNARAGGALNSIQDVRDLFSPTGNIVSETTTGEEVINFRENANGPFQPQKAFPVIGVQDGDTNDFAICATAPLFIEETGIYTFGFNSDDGGGLFIDDRPAVIFDANRGSATSLDTIQLTAGQHEMKFYYWERGGGAQVQVFWRPEVGDFTGDGADDGTIVANYELLEASLADPTDSDGDGIPDQTERALLGDDLTQLGTGDFDGDGINDPAEISMGLDPTQPDTDGDGLNDGDEGPAGTNPLNPDSDGDGLSDGDEVNVYGTDPLDPDTDGDGVADGLEVTNGTNPLLDDITLPSALIGYWTMDEGNVDNQAQDEYHGLEDGSPIDYDAGMFGEAAHLDGTNCIVIQNSGNDFAFVGESMSVSAWFTADTIDTSWQALVAKGEGNSWRMHRRGGDNPPQMAWTGGNGDTPATPDAQFSVGPDEWHHVVGVTDTEANLEILYLDGVEVARKDLAGGLVLNSTQNARIGENPDARNRRWKGKVDDVAIWNRALTAEEIADLHGSGLEGQSLGDILGGPGLNPLGLAVARVGDQLEVSWNSEPGQLYDLLSETGLQTEIASWSIWNGNEMIPASPPRQSLMIPIPDDEERYFAIRSYPTPPEVVFSDDFESGQGGWTTSGGPTSWELGTPAPAVSGGPPSALSGTNVFGTDLDGGYADSSNSVLCSPPIDLSGVVSATLRYHRWLDIEATFDMGRVRLVDAADDSEITILEESIEGASTEWEETSYDLPPEAVGKTVIVYFELVSDDFNPNPLAGFYIDDVTVEGSAP